jgi:hypothetical protein
MGNTQVSLDFRTCMGFGEPFSGAENEKRKENNEGKRFE